MKNLIIAISAIISISAIAGTKEIPYFGLNEGLLRMFVYTPKNVKPNAPLIVLLHGCNQRAQDIDNETGFAQLAESSGSLLLIPEQTKFNNSQACFNWFSPFDFLRNRGESGSIAQMIRYLQVKGLASKKKVFIAGLSAGGAMAAVMLATYPDMFKAGATVAGIPFGCASDVFGAFKCMKSIDRTGAEWKWLVKAAYRHRGDYPKVMILQGTEDPYVSPDNATELKEQWNAIHQIEKGSVITDNSKMLHTSYSNSKRGSVVETVILKGMGHGLPVDSKNGCGKTGKWIINHGVCAADLLGRFFKLK